MKVEKRGLFAVLLLICLLGLVGCGGGSNSKTTPLDTTPPTTTLTLKSEAGLDGHISHWFTEPESYGISNTTGFQVGFMVNSDNTKIALRGFVSFNLSSLPAGATIKSAILRVYQEYIQGYPYDTLGNISVNHVSYESLDQGPAFSVDTEAGQAVKAIYDIAPLDKTIPIDSFLSTDPTLGYKTLDVTAAVQADQTMSRARSQFRLGFQTEVADSGIHLAYFYSGESDTNRPELVIEYTL